MKHIIKILIFIIVFVILTMFFSPSFSKVSIDNIAVVVAIGMDVVSDSNTQNNIKVSFQFTDASSVSESGSTENSPSILKTVSASSISSAINLMNTFIDKEITLSHCKLIVFSEEIKKHYGNSFKDVLYYLDERNPSDGGNKNETQINKQCGDQSL